MSFKIRQAILQALPIRMRFAMRYMAAHKRFSLLLFPQLFTEKNMLRVAKDRSRLMRICADKLTMRQYVSENVGSHFLPKLLSIASNENEINWSVLPSRFVIKASHGSGMVRIVDSFDIAKKDLIAELQAQCKRWLSIDWGSYSREWAYTNLPRRILIEEFVESNCCDIDGIPWDFKLFVFSGKCRMIQVDTGRYHNHRMNLYSPSWELFNSTYIGLYPQAEFPLQKPQFLDDLVALSEKIGSSIDFIRVDLYSTGQGPLVGELTMTPGGGIEVKFTDPKLDKYLGAFWKMSPFHNQS